MVLPAAANRALQGLRGNVGTGVSAACGCLCLVWSGNSILKEAGGKEKTLTGCSAMLLAPG